MLSLVLVAYRLEVGSSVRRTTPSIRISSYLRPGMFILRNQDLHNIPPTFQSAIGGKLLEGYSIMVEQLAVGHADSERPCEN